VRADRRALVAGAALVYLAGIWWGLPWVAWAPDELPPGVILDAIAVRFSGGWHDKYPPMQFYLDAALYAPLLAAARAGWIDLTTRTGGVLLLLLPRLLSVAMALGTVIAIHGAASDLYGRRGAIAATLLATLTPPFVFYAKLANVDVPYLFWVAWALRFYVRAVRSGARDGTLPFALAAVTATATKDQAIGFFVLPALHLGYLAARSRQWRALLAPIAAAACLLALELNVPFNLHGVLSHVSVITGGASQDFRLPGTFWERQAMVASLTVQQLAWSMTWPGLAVSAAGIVAQIRRRDYLWLLLPAISYYLVFLVTAGYVYDRFLMGMVFVLALFAGGWIDGALRAGAAAIRWRVAAVAAFAAVFVWYGASIDLMMALESRYAAERWLKPRAREGWIGLVGFAPYLPRVRGIRLAAPEALDPATLPRFVVVNAEVMRRDVLPPAERAWNTWLSSGQSPYDVAARFKTAPALSLLTYTDVFRNGREDGTTNLDKVGPEIVVYERRDLR
jgi:hypothetical protein